MNKIYHTVWNETTQSWVAVSEANSAKGKKSRSLKAGVITAGATVALLNIAMTSPDAKADYLLDGSWFVSSPTGIACAAVGTTTTFTCQVPGATGGFATISVNAANVTSALSAANTWATSNLKGIVLGDSTTSATGASAIAIGNGAQVTQAGGVALGQSSVADTAAGATGYVPTGASAAQTAAVAATKSTLAAVSVGSTGNTRQITNVAAGTTDTDAVNVAQLKAVSAAAAAGAVHYYSVNDGGATGGNYNNDGATGTNALAAGVNASTSVANSVAIGNGATITHMYGGTGTVVIGNNASSTTSNVYDSPTTANVVIGNAAVSTAGLGQTVVIGNGANSQVGQATVMGTNASATSVFGADPATGSTFESGSVAIGYGATTYIDGSTVASGWYSPTAVGAYALAMADGAVALGEAAEASIVKSTSLGTNSKVTVANGVALGADSVANTAAGAVGYVPTGANATETAAIAATNSTTLGAVSVGSTGNTRQITNVAAGTANSDAVNVSQLKAVTTLAAAAKTEVVAGTNVKDVTSSTGANGQTIYTVNAKATTASAGSSAVTVTAGTPDANNVTDYAVDLSQDTKDSLVKADTALQSIETQIDGVTVKTVNKDDNKVNFVTGDNVELTANADGSITVGTAADVTFNSVTTNNLTATGDTHLGDSFTVNKGGSYYTGPITEGDHITNKTYVDQQTAAAKTEVAAGTNVKDVVKTQGTNGQDIYTVNAKGTTASAGSSAVTVTAGTPDANNVTDYAVDLSQDTKDSLVKADTALQSIETQIDGVTVKTVNKDDNKVNFVTGDNVELTANADGSITVGTAADVTFNSVTTNNLTATGDTHLGDSFTVNKGGSYYTGPITEGDHITNKTYVDQQTAAAKTEVAAGTNVKDVVKTQGTNGQDIYTVNAKGTTASAGSSAVTVTAGTPDANNVTDYAVDLSQDTKDSLVKADTALQSIETQIDGVTVKTVNKDDNKVNFVTGDNVELTANADGSITVGTAADVTFNSVTTNNLTATGDTHLGDSFTVNKGGSYYTGPITEGDHITNKTYVDQQTAAAKTEVAAGTNVKDVVKTQGTNGQDIYTVNAKGTTASAGSSAVTVTAGTPDANNVTDYAVDLSQDTKDSLVKADTALQSIETQIDGVTVKTVNKDDNKVNFVTGDNVELTANADGSITVGTAADVTFNSVTTNNLTATGDTHLGDSFTVNKGGSYYTGPITEGDHITNKTYVDQQTAAAKTEVAAGTNVKDVVKTQGTNGQDIYTVNAKGTTASAGSSAVTVTAGTPDANNVTDYAVDLSQDTKDSLVKADTALQSIETQIDGVTVKTVNKDDNKVNFVTGDNVELTANADGSITVGTAADVTFNSVTTNNLTATGETKLGDSFIVNNTGATYTGPITEGNHIVNKDYVDNSVNVLADTPLNFAGNTGDAIAKKLGETLTISGELAEGEDATGANLRVDSANGILNLMMAKDLTDLNSIVINGGPTINNNGINMNGGTITNLAAGVADSDAVNMSQLKEVSNVANAGWNIATDSGTTSNVKPGDTVNMKGDGSIVVSNTGNDVTVGLADVVTVGQGDTAVTIDGTKGTIQAGTEVTIDGNTGVIQAGDVTINGDKGTVNGLSNTTWDANNIVKGQAATEDQLKVVADNVTTAVGAAKTEVEAGKNVTVSSQLGDNNQTIYTVATKDEVDFNKVTVGGLTIDKGNVDANSNTIISGVGAGEISSTSTDAVNGSQLYATNQQVAQNTTNIAKNTTDITNINTTLDKGLNFSADSGSTVNRKLGDTVAITGDGNITTTTTANGVQVKLSDSIDVKNVNVSQNFTVAEGANVNMGGNVIQNVGAGVADTDAVNVGQLKNVANHISNVEDKLSGGIAASAALAVVTPVEPGTYHLSGGTAYYNGGYGVGFNLLKRSDNGRTTMHAGVAWGSGGGGALVRIGAGFSFGGN